MNKNVKRSVCGLLLVLLLTSRGNAGIRPTCVAIQGVVSEGALFPNAGKRYTCCTRQGKQSGAGSQTFSATCCGCRPLSAGGAADSLDSYLANQGLLDISTLDSTFRIDLMYARGDNFLQKAVYKGITRAWLRPEAARMLVEANRALKKEHPHWTLIIYDAARPLSVQRRMWQIVRGTAHTSYVSNPANGGGLHNYGMAVDVTIADETGQPLSMGTPVDYFGAEAHTNQEEKLVDTGRISREAYENRRLLRHIMRSAGFRTILYEWWHFNACSRAFAREHYPVIE